MSTLFEQLLYTTLRIECKDNDGNLTGIGTGFLLSRPVSGDKYKLYLVSNKHILIGTPKILVSFICKENGEPQHQRVHKVEIQGVDQAVKGHPDPEVDIAAIECTGMLVVIYALSDFLIMILSWLVKQSLRAFLFQEVQP